MSDEKADPQAALIDGLADDRILDCLGPDWSKMTPAQREAYGRGPVEPDPLFAALERVGGQDLAAQIEEDIYDILERCEPQLIRLENLYITTPTAREAYAALCQPRSPDAPARAVLEQGAAHG